MNARIWLALALLPPLFVNGCICSGDGINAGDINVISLEEEWRLGTQLAREIAAQVPVISDSEAQSYLDEMGGRLVAATDLADLPWNFYIIEDTSVNAFNIPGGHVFVHTGLFAAAESPSEFAGVLAHEVAHGVARHATERMTTTYGLNLLVRIITGGEVTLLEQIAAQLLGSGALSKFSRDDEREADRLGLYFMARTGYDPDGMATMFETILAYRDRRPNMVERFFSTHPLTEERIENITREAGGLERFGRAPDQARFERIRARVRSYHGRHWEPSARPVP